MVFDASEGHRCSMIMVEMEIDARAAGRTTRVRLPLAPGYGTTAAVAHELVVLAVTAAEWPLVMDAYGSLHRFPAGAVHSVRTWSTPPEQPVRSGA